MENPIKTSSESTEKEPSNDDLLTLFDPLVSLNGDGAEGLKHRESSSSVLDLAYDNTEAFELFEDENSCPICFEVFCSTPPRHVLDCPCCAKSFCQRCLEKSSDKAAQVLCPMCRQSFAFEDARRNETKEKSVAHLPGFCVTCNVQMSRGELEEHEPKCLPSSEAKAPPQDDCVTKPNSRPTNSWSCPKCTFLNHPDLPSCEICDFSVAPAVGLSSGQSGAVTSQGTATTTPVVPNDQVVFEGTLYVQAQTKLVFKKWKRVRVKVSARGIELYPMGGVNSLTNRSSPLKSIPLHRHMRFGKIYHSPDTKIVDKSFRGAGKSITRNCYHKTLYTSKLYENPQFVLKAHPEIRKAGRFQPKDGMFRPVLQLATESERTTKEFVRGVSRVIVNSRSLY